MVKTMETAMRCTCCIWALLVAVLAGEGRAWGQAGPSGPPEAVTAKVTELLRDLLPGGKVLEVKSGQTMGLTIYEVRAASAREECRIRLADNGALIDVTTKVDPKLLAAKVQAAAVEKAGGGTIRDASAVLTESQAQLVPLARPAMRYNVRVARETGRDLMVVVTEDGTVVSCTEAGPPKGGPGMGPGGGKPGKQTVSIEQLPAAVRAALRKEAGSNIMVRLEQEARGDVVSYRGTWLVGDVPHELRLTAEGGLLEQRQQVPLHQLPEAVMRAMQQNIPDLSRATCQKITRNIDGQMQESFEVKADVEGAKKHLVISTDGQVEVKGPGGPKGPKGPKGPQDGPPAEPK